MSEMPKGIYLYHATFKDGDRGQMNWMFQDDAVQPVHADWTLYTRADICDPTNLLRLNREQGEIIRGLQKQIDDMRDMALMHNGKLYSRRQLEAENTRLTKRIDDLRYLLSPHLTEEAIDERLNEMAVTNFRRID